MSKKTGNKLQIDKCSVHPKAGAAKATASIRRMHAGRKAGSLGNTYQKLPAKHGNTKGNV